MCFLPVVRQMAGIIIKTRPALWQASVSDSAGKQGGPLGECGEYGGPRAWRFCRYGKERENSYEA